MTDYKEMYLLLFRSVEKARRILTEEPFTRGNVQRTVQILELAQIESEAVYMEGTDD